mmetsp:Transcript_8305/g.24952  ORF Transcript_8305/g.24952 Transcript_8305/m.24952 type:complete len:132 (+) Transcript_8305:3-398(+)
MMWGRAVSRLHVVRAASWPSDAQLTLVRAARSATRKKYERSVLQKMSRMESSHETEEEGVFRGQITALTGRFMQVTLDDGRVVKAKPAGKINRPGQFQQLKIGLTVHVQYSLDEDEDGQTPRIISREPQSA